MLTPKLRRRINCCEAIICLQGLLILPHRAVEINQGRPEIVILRIKSHRFAKASKRLEVLKLTQVVIPCIVPGRTLVRIKTRVGKRCVRLRALVEQPRNLLNVPPKSATEIDEE